MLDRLIAKSEQLEKEIKKLQNELNLNIIKYNLLSELIDEELAQQEQEAQPQEEAVEETQPSDAANPIY